MSLTHDPHIRFAQESHQLAVKSWLLTVLSLVALMSLLFGYAKEIIGPFMATILAISCVFINFLAVQKRESSQKYFYRYLLSTLGPLRKIDHDSYAIQHPDITLCIQLQLEVEAPEESWGELGPLSQVKTIAKFKVPGTTTEQWIELPLAPAMSMSKNRFMKKVKNLETEFTNQTKHLISTLGQRAA